MGPGDRFTYEQEFAVILHVIDPDGNSFYVTDINAIDAATNQPRVVFVDPAAGRTFVHLYSDFFKVVRVTNEDGEEVEVPQYQVQGIVESIPAGSGYASNSNSDASKKASRKKRNDRPGAETGLDPATESMRGVIPVMRSSDTSEREEDAAT